MVTLPLCFVVAGKSYELFVYAKTDNILVDRNISK